MSCAAPMRRSTTCSGLRCRKQAGSRGTRRRRAREAAPSRRVTSAFTRARRPWQYSSRTASLISFSCCTARDEHLCGHPRTPVPRQTTCPTAPSAFRPPPGPDHRNSTTGQSPRTDSDLINADPAGRDRCHRRRHRQSMTHVASPRGNGRNPNAVGNGCRVGIPMQANPAGSRPGCARSTRRRRAEPPEGDAL